jgi:hypothetical protein
MEPVDHELGKSLLGAMDERRGLPRPDWGEVQARWLAMPESEQAAAWSAVERTWMRALAEAWGVDFRVIERDECVVTTDLPDVEAERVLRFMGEALRKIERCLIGLGLTGYADGGPGCDVAVVCRSAEDYLDYVGDAQDPAYVGSGSGGVCLHDGSVHVAAHGKSLDDLRGVLAHELAHTRLAQLQLPTWLEEGLIVHLELAVTPQDAFPPPVELQSMKHHRRFWTRRRLGEWFTGHAFRGPDDSFGLAHRLAHHVVGQLLSDDPQRFAVFVESAAWEDRGQGASQAVYGCGLADLLPAWVREAAAANSEAHGDPDP